MDNQHRMFLRCPVCVRDPTKRAEVSDPGWVTSEREGWLICVHVDCCRKYPILDGVPVMLREEGDKWRECPTDDLPDTDDLARIAGFTV